MNDAEFRRVIRDRRTSAGLTQRQLAARMGVGHTTISHLEAGFLGASERLLWGVARALDMDVFALHAMVGRIPNACRPRSYEKALVASAAFRTAAKCSPREPCCEPHTRLRTNERNENHDSPTPGD